MNWLWIIALVLAVFFLNLLKRKKRDRNERRIAQEFFLKRKHEKAGAIWRDENYSAPNEAPTLVKDALNNTKVVAEAPQSKGLSDNLTAPSERPTVNKKSHPNQKAVTIAPAKIGASYNDLVEQKQKRKQLKQEALLDPLSGISLEEIVTDMQGLRALIGQDKIKSDLSDQEYEIDMGLQTCTCEIFAKKAQFPVNDARRFCCHMIEVFDRRNAFDRVDHRTRMVAEFSSTSPVFAAYALKHIELPLVYLLIEEENPWLSLYGREKRAGETIYNASGEFMRHGYNILEHRWAYGSGIVGASFLNPFLKSINKLEDIDGAVDEITKRPQKLALTEQADPRQNPNYASDQYGPVHDAYEIPESALRYEHPCECSLLFSYVDGRGGRSRRTVDFKKLQYFGSEGPYLYGECRMRKAGRTFDTHKMTAVIDVITGEVIENVREYAENYWHDSTKAKLLNWADNNDRFAKAFLFLLKGNKRATKADYVALSEIFSDLLDGAKVTTSDIQYLYSDLVPTTAVGFQRLVGGILKHHPDQVAWFKECAFRMVNARAKPNFADQAAIEYVNKRIS